MYVYNKGYAVDSNTILQICILILKEEWYTAEFTDMFRYLLFLWLEIWER